MNSRIVPDIVPSPDVLTSHLEGEAVLLHMGTKRYFRLNRTGAHIWKALEAGVKTPDITQSLADVFDVSRSEADEAVSVLVSELLENSLVSEASSTR
ncbi:MAG: PqqD family protein [bacterium]